MVNVQSECSDVNSENFRGVMLYFLIYAICVAESASVGDYPVIKHSVPKIRVAIERNKYQNCD